MTKKTPKFLRSKLMLGSMCSSQLLDAKGVVERESQWLHELSFILKKQKAGKSILKRP